MKLFDRDTKVRLLFAAALAVAYLGFGIDAISGIGTIILANLIASRISNDYAPAPHTLPQERC